MGAAERRAKAAARRQERIAEAAVAAPDPLAPLQERLAKIEEQLTTLQTRRRQGDVFAGRLIETLERERKDVLAKLGDDPKKNAHVAPSDE